MTPSGNRVWPAITPSDSAFTASMALEGCKITGPLEDGDHVIQLVSYGEAYGSRRGAVSHKSRTDDHG